MTTVTVSPKWQVVIAKDVREKLPIKVGMHLQMIAIGDTVGIASVNIENGQSGTVSLRGVYNQIPKKTHATDEAFTLMQSVYFDGTAKKLTNTQAGNIFAGYAWQTAASDAGTATIKLHL